MDKIFMLTTDFKRAIEKFNSLSTEDLVYLIHSKINGDGVKYRDLVHEIATVLDCTPEHIYISFRHTTKNRPSFLMVIAVAAILEYNLIEFLTCTERDIEHGKKMAKVHSTRGPRLYTKEFKLNYVKDFGVLTRSELAEKYGLAKSHLDYFYRSFEKSLKNYK